MGEEQPPPWEIWTVQLSQSHHGNCRGHAYCVGRPRRPLHFTLTDAMSTTTVFEVPDTPMLDYAHDADFSMEVGHSPQWLPVEATMSDEQIPTLSEDVIYAHKDIQLAIVIFKRNDN